MTKIPKPTGRTQGVLLALAIVFLQGISASKTKDPAPVTGTPKTAAVSLVVAKPECGGLTVTGPNSVSRYVGATFTISNWTGQCITWYYYGVATTTTNGSFTVFFDQWTVGEKSIMAIEHTGCTPYGQYLKCGSKNFTVY